MTRATVCMPVLLAAAIGFPPVSADDRPVDPARRTDTVRLIERLLPAVVSVIAEVEDANGQRETRVGSGSIIHRNGFVLTNEHVIRGMRNGGVVLADGTLVPVRVVAKFVHEDLAVLQLAGDRTWPVLPLGRSDDLLLGEPALVIGTPGGLTHSVSTGIVSGLNRSTRNESNLLPWMIQTSAAVSRGNSGGPLINAVGEQIGIISTIGGDLQNVSFAIEVDHVREVIPSMLDMEQRGSFWFGLRCDPLADAAVVREVEPGSPAEKGGLAVGDRLLRIGGVELTTGVDLQLALYRRRRGDQLDVQFEREGEVRTTTVTLATLPLPSPVAATDLQSGLEFRVYRGNWSALPDFSTLECERSGRCTTIDLAAIDAPVEEFGAGFTGLLRVPAEDLYAFYTTSDDGSRLWIGDRLLVDNDGLHPALERGGLIRLPAGLHPIRIEFFERSGAEGLTVAWESPTIPKEKLPADVLFTPRSPTDDPAPP